MTAEWYEYVNRFDAMLAFALITSAVNSLTNIFNALHAEGETLPAPLIVLNANVENKMVRYYKQCESIVLLEVIDFYS